MYRKIAYYSLILCFVIGTAQSFAMSCHMVGADLTDNIHTSSSNNDCHDNISENDNKESSCQFCKICSSSTVSLIEQINFLHIKNIEINHHIVSNHRSIFKKVPTPPPNI